MLLQWDFDINFFSEVSSKSFHNSSYIDFMQSDAENFREHPVSFNDFIFLCILQR